MMLGFLSFAKQLADTNPDAELFVTFWTFKDQR
jgi:hypothetical protein